MTTLHLHENYSNRKQNSLYERIAVVEYFRRSGDFIFGIFDLSNVGHQHLEAVNTQNVHTLCVYNWQAVHGAYMYMYLVATRAG